MSRDDPFGSGGKTVIRPNPGGARPSEPRIDQSRGVPPGQAQPTMPQPTTPQYRPAQPTGVPAADDDWLRGPLPGQPAPAAQPPRDAPRIPLEVALNARDSGQLPASNPITAAAMPLLILLGRLRLMIVDMQAVPLMNHVANQIREFERSILAAGVDPHDARVATYALCGTADDIVQNLPGTDRHAWLQHSMLAQFFQVRTSGVGFYEELGKILQNPAAKYDLLELMHACLCLGFEGQYRGSPQGASELQRVRRDVYQTLRHLRARANDDISPRWQGLNLKMPQLTSRIPLWAVASAAAAVAVGVFILLRVLLGNGADDLSGRLIALHPNTPVTLERAAFTPAQIPDTRDPTQLERIRAALAGEIDAGGLAVDAVGDEIVINISNTLLFASGSAEVEQSFADIATRVAEALDREPGPISVIGHTDNVRMSGGGRFKSNHDLSVARAEAVKETLAGAIDDPSRLVVEGRGELEPIGDNATSEGRAQNRRVEIVIPREETLEASA